MVVVVVWWGRWCGVSDGGCGGWLMVVVVGMVGRKEGGVEMCFWDGFWC